MPKSIFDYVTSSNLVSYWNTMNLAETDALLGDELFPSQQKLGLNLDWIKGASGLPVVLKPSAYDVAALKRDRIGFEEVRTKMPFFKESVMVDEELRQNLNMVAESGNQAYIDMINNRIFDDEMGLLRGARAQRERMRMSLLTTGGITISANGQNYDYDYGLAAYQQKTSDWTDPDTDVITDIRTWQDAVEEKTGTRPTRAVCRQQVMAYLYKNNLIRNAIWGNDSTAPTSREKVRQYIKAETNLTIVEYEKQFIDEAGQTKKYVPADTFVMFPEGSLGTGWFGTTPEQSDLMTGSAANVTITDVGVAVTTMKKYDPVNVDTKVSMIYLPSFERIPEILIASVGH
jgi:hypothetical protein